MAQATHHLLVSTSILHFRTSVDDRRLGSKHKDNPMEGHYHVAVAYSDFSLFWSPPVEFKTTFSLANWSPLVGEEEMAQDMRGAFDEWAKYGNLKFVRVFTPEADIVVGFGSRYHGDR